jgi:hypothetical protein
LVAQIESIEPKKKNKKQKKILMQKFQSVKVSLQKMNRKTQKKLQNVKVISL